MKKFLFLFCALSLCSHGYSQSFETVINGLDLIEPCADSNLSYGFDIVKINNDFMVLAQEQAGFDTECVFVGGVGYSLIRLNNQGDTLFRKTFMHPELITDSAGSYMPRAMDISSDSMIYVVGIQDNFGLPDEMFLAKHKPNGDLVWKTNYSGQNYVSPYALLVDDSLLFIGCRNYIADFEKQVIIMQVDTSGAVMWTEYSDTLNVNMVTNLTKRIDDYVVVGTYNPPGSMSNSYQIFTIEFDETGMSNMVNTYGNPNNNYSYTDALFNYENHLVIGAFSSFYNDALVIEIDTNNVVIDQFISQPSALMDSYRFRQIIQTTDSNYVLLGDFGYQSPPLNSNFDRTLSMRKVDNNGYDLWSKNYAGEVFEALEMYDGGLVVAGKRHNQPLNLLGYYSTLVLRADSIGNTGECQPQFILSYYNAHLTDSLPVSGVIHLYNNSYGEEENFTWSMNGFSWFLYDFSESYQASDTGWNVVSLTGCGMTYSDSIYIFDYSVSLLESTLEHIDIYPNPTTEITHVQTKNSESTELVVRNILGELIYVVQFKEDISVDMADWPSGTYLFELQLGSAHQRRKVVKL